MFLNQYQSFLFQSPSLKQFQLSGLTRKKKYDVKVRAYKKVGSKKYYGTFSASKRVKVKQNGNKRMKENL